MWGRVKADFIDPIMSAMQGVREMIQGAIALDWDMVKGGFERLTQGIANWVQNIARIIRDTIMGVLPAWMINALETVGGGLSTAADNIRGGFDRINPFGEGSPMRDMLPSFGGGGSSSINMNADVQVNVPAGTSQEQAIAIDRQVRDSMARQLMSAQQQIVVAE